MILIFSQKHTFLEKCIVQYILKWKNSLKNFIKKVKKALDIRAFSKTILKGQGNTVDTSKQPIR
jgi:hypothetical protein